MTYSPPRYFSLEDLQNRFGEAAVCQLFDDDGDREPDTAPVVAIIEEASGAADAILYASFGVEVVAKLKEDTRFRSAVCDIAMSLAGERKHEFGGGMGDKAPYASLRKRGEDTLRLLGKGAERFAAEAAHGKNPTLRARTSVTLPVRHTFATSRTNPRGSGGF
jgi:phage gp36-like protein